MEQPAPIIKRTVCALCVSHYQMDVLDEWFVRWGAAIKRHSVPVNGESALSAFDLWQVEAPLEAFDELSDEFFAAQSLALTAEAARRHITIM